MYEFLVAITVEDVMNALCVYEESARELLNGVIRFETHELARLAEYKGIMLTELIEVE